MAEDQDDADRRRILREAEERLLLSDVDRAEDAAASFLPRTVLARTPPSSFSTPYTTPMAARLGAAAKRTLTSPEEYQEATRRRLLLQQGDPEVPQEELVVDQHTEAQGLCASTNEALVSLATVATSGIMEAIRCKTSKLNKDEIAAIGQHVDAVGSVVTHLLARLAKAEQRAAVAEVRLRAAAPTTSMTRTEPPSTSIPLKKSYAGAIKLGRNSEPWPIPVRLGPTVAVFPAEDQKERIKTADDTKKLLQASINPAGLGIKVQGVRRTGGAGLIVETTSAKDAQTIRSALPAALRVGEPRERRPLVSLVGVDADLKQEEVLEKLFEQNFSDHEDSITLASLKTEVRPLFCRSRRGNKKMWVCESTAAMRRRLIDTGRVYIGWDVVEVVDFVNVTCCKKCQMFGHPEKYCRAKVMTCGKCGEDGHKSAECQAVAAVCATCKKLHKKNAGEHRTNSTDCPARKHAEERAIATTDYHG